MGQREQVLMVGCLLSVVLMPIFFHSVGGLGTYQCQFQIYLNSTFTTTNADQSATHSSEDSLKAQ